MAGLTTTQTFSDGDTVTAAKLNNIISDCTIDDDAVVTAKIDDDAVTLANMADDSVDTGQLVDDAVQNSKLNDMAARTVKVNATDAADNPTDIPMSNGTDVDENKLLVGTTDSINAVKFDTDLELDATDSAAADIRVADTLISGKSDSFTIAPTTDTVLICDADGTGNKLRKATVKDAVQSQVADTSTSGVTRLATTAKIIQPTGQSAASTDVLSVGSNSTVLPRAWGTIDYNKKFDTTSGGTWSRLANFNLDNPSNSGYVISFVFSTSLDTGTSSYMIQTDAYYSNSDAPAADGTNFLSAIGVITARSNTGFDIRFRSYDGTDVMPYRINLIVYV